jgi:hypothetical protein
MERGIVSSWIFGFQPGVDCKAWLVGKSISVVQSLVPRIARDSEDQIIDHPNRANSATFVIASSQLASQYECS